MNLNIRIGKTLSRFFPFLILSFLLSASLIAEDLDTLRQYTLDSIVVSSFKLPNKTWAVPVAATSMNAVNEWIAAKSLTWKIFRLRSQISSWSIAIRDWHHLCLYAYRFADQHTGGGHVCGWRSAFRKIVVRHQSCRNRQYLISERSTGNTLRTKCDGRNYFGKHDLAFCSSGKRPSNFATAATTMQWLLFRIWIKSTNSLHTEFQEIIIITMVYRKYLQKRKSRPTQYRYA